MEFTITQRMIPIALAGLILVVIIELIRRRKLSEEYAILWIFAAGTIMVFAVFPELIWTISAAVGIHYLTLLLMLGFAFMALIAIQFAIAITRLASQQRSIAQRLALLHRRRERLDGGGDAPDRQGRNSQPDAECDTEPETENPPQP